MERVKGKLKTRRSFWLVAAFLLFTGVMPLSSHAAGRVALVIGNGDYKAAPLKNPVNDAKDIAKSLQELGFDVIRKTNSDQRGMDEAMAEFYKRLQNAEVGIFYYAGHGVQIDGMNYLIPLKAEVRNPSDVKYKAVAAGRVLGMMGDAGNKLNIVILDACRDNPFRSYFRSQSKGLAFMDAPDGTIVAYATAPGSVAQDGAGRNGLYTQHLLKNLARRDLNVLEMFNRTGLDVKRATGSTQTPWTTNSPMENYYLAGGNPEVVSDAGPKYLTPDTGSLKVSSEPAGADVRIDGKPAGRTPVEFGDMMVGPVTVAVSRNGYIGEERLSNIKQGRRTVVSFELKKQHTVGWLTVVTDPADAKVRILNIVPKYYSGMELEAGRYHIEVTSSGYRREKKWVELLPGDDIRVLVNLERDKQQGAPVPEPAATSASPSRSSGKTYKDPITGMEFVYVEGGCFKMGDLFGDGDSDERPVHEVCLDSYYIGRYEVTQGQYQKIAGTNPAKFQKGSQFPVEKVSWDDAQKFIATLNAESGKTYRLPTEAEWEHAARSGGKKEKYSGNNSLDPVGWYWSNSGGSTRKVGSKAPNGLGIFDMSGNVWEWCQDWYGDNYYSRSPRNNPAGPSSGPVRVMRGGGWGNEPFLVRAASRSRVLLWERDAYTGFRLVLVP